MPKNTKGGKGTRKQAKQPKEIPTLSKLGENQMFALVLQNHGDHFRVRGSDGCERTGPNTGTVKKLKIIKEYEGVIVVIDTTDKEHCSIIARGDPPKRIREILTGESNRSSGFEFVSSDKDKYKAIIEAQKNNQVLERKVVSMEDRLGLPPMDSDSDYDEEEEEEELEVDKFGNTIEKVNSTDSAGNETGVASATITNASDVSSTESLAKKAKKADTRSKSEKTNQREEFIVVKRNDKGDEDDEDLDIDEEIDNL